MIDTKQKCCGIRNGRKEGARKANVHRLDNKRFYTVFQSGIFYSLVSVFPQNKLLRALLSNEK